MTQKSTMCFVAYPAPVNYIECGYSRAASASTVSPVFGHRLVTPTPADLDIGILDESGQQMPVMSEEREEERTKKVVDKDRDDSVKQSGASVGWRSTP